MKNHCNWKPEQIKNKDGVLEDPILYEDLMKITDNNRDLSLDIYRMVDQDFIDQYGGVLKYDSQGKPTLSSLLKIPAVKYIFDSRTDNVLGNLNKQFKAGVYSYDEAVEKVASFNRNPNFNDKYFATITEVTEGKDKGKMRFSIIENAPSAKRALENMVIQRSFRDKLMYVLANTGVKVDFVDKMLGQDAGVEGIYSTYAPEKYAETLYNIIKVLNGKPNTLDVLKEETGHLVVGIAENNARTKTLFDRLMKLMKNVSPKEIKEILVSRGGYTEEQAQKFADDTLMAIESSDDAQREAAGRVIACELDKVDTHLRPYNLNRVAKTLVTLGNRIASLFKAIFKASKASLSKGKDVNVDIESELRKDNIIREAKELAKKFMNQDLGDVEDAFGTKEERHHQSLLEARVANRLVTSFQSFIRQLKNSGLSPADAMALEGEINKGLKVRKIFEHTAQRQRERIEAGLAPEGTDEAYISRGYYNMISSMLESIKDVIQQMEGNTFEALTSGNFSERLQNGELATIPDLNEKIKCVTQLLSLIRLCNEAETIMDQVSGVQANQEFVSTYNIDGLRSEIRNMIVPIMKGVDTINRQIFEASLATVNGGHDYIKASRRLVRDKGVTTITDEIRPGLGVNKATIQQFLDGEIDGKSLTEDAHWWGVWLQKMGSSVDVINQLVSNLYDFNKAEANKEMYRYSQILLDLHERIKEELGDEDTSFMCELNKDGQITGNIVQPNFDYGTWEKDFDEWQKATKKQLREDNEDELSKMNMYEQGEWLYEHMQPLYEEWHKEHSQIRPEDYIDDLFDETGFEQEGPRLRYLPGTQYASDQWDKLSDKQKQFVREYVRIKQSLDQFIEEYHPNSITSHRLPQFRGTTISKMKHKSTYVSPEGARNLRQKAHDKLMQKNSIYRTLHDEFIANFFEDALDEDFGDNSCYNNEEDTFFKGSSLTDREFMRRVPVYGVNKLSDMHNLSTDLVYSTMQYAAMSLNVRGMATTAAVLLNGVDILKERTINGLMEKSRRGDTSNVFKRYTKFLEMQVFNIRSNKFAIMKTKSGRTLLANKIMSWISKEGSWWLLAGKVASGFVNTGTGCFQIVSEAAVGDHFNRQELIEAIYDYYKYAAQANFTEGLAPLNRSNKYYSFIRYYDSLNQNDSYFRDFASHIQLGKMSQLRRVNYAMWVYESGNHFMQSLPYRLKGKHTKLYKLKEGVDPTAENLEDAENFIESGNIWDNFDEAQLQRGKNVEKFRKKREKETGETYINERPVIITTPEEETGMWGNPYQEEYYVKNPDGSFVRYDRSAQSRFQTQCRYMTDNMHGIYNNPDALAVSQNVLGAAILTMKKYLFGYADKLFLTDRYSVADGRNTEGCAISWLKMMDYYLRHGDWKMKARLYSMGAPIVASFALQFPGAQALSAISALSYNFIVSNANIKGIKNQMERDGIAKYQRDNIKRFDTYMRLALMLRTLGNLLTNSLFAHHQDDDTDEVVELNWGEKTDDAILKMFGYDRYEEALSGELTKAGGRTLKQSPKTPGLLYTIVDDAIKNMDDDEKRKALLRLQYGMGMSYYFLHRWQLESETLFPFDLNVNTIKETKTQLAQYANLYPVGPSWFGTTSDAIINCFEAQKPVTYKYDKESENFADLFERYGDWDEEKIPDFIYAVRTGQHIVAEDNRGVNKLIQMVPYLNSLGFFEDPYKAAVSYDFGRKMTSSQ